MNSFKILLLLAFASASAGGDNQCSQIEAEFAAVQQVTEDMINKLVLIVQDVAQSYPILTNTYINNYYCKMNGTVNILAKATTGITGICQDYTFNALNGSILTPFISGMDCIQDQVLSFVNFTRNISENVLPELSKKAQVSPVNSSMPCSEVNNITTPYDSFRNFIIQTLTKNKFDDLNAFRNVGYGDAFVAYFPELDCTKKAIIDTIVALYNYNITEVENYMDNLRGPVPPALYCFPQTGANDIEDATDAIKNLNQTINNQNGTLSCQPLQDNFRSFAYVWNNYTSGLQEIMINNSLTHPVLIPGFISSFICELNVMINLAASTTSFLANVSSNLVHDVLSGQTNPPVSHPLGCIHDELTSMKNQIWSWLNIVIPGLTSYTANSTSNITTCESTFHALRSNIPILIEWENSKIELALATSDNFPTIRTTSSFLDSFATVAKCTPSVLGTFVGAALHSNGSIVTNYLHCDTNPLTYPFNCVQILIDIMESLMNQANYNIVLKNINTLSAPRLPSGQ